MPAHQPAEPVTVVGIGADGWPGLADPARQALLTADVVVGAVRQLDLLPPAVTAERVTWPSPLRPAVRPLIEAHAGRRTCVLASGDPSFHGIATTLVEELGADRVRSLPHPSSLSLACARLGWALERTDPVSAVGRDPAAVRAAVHPGAHLLVLLAPPHTAADVARLLTDIGYGASALTLLTRLGAADEARRDGTARDWPDDVHDPLAVLAVDARPDPTRTPPDAASLHGRLPGLPDTAFEHDGQITKREIRALTLAALAPRPGELLWDVGGGSGSVAIEWLRTHPRCRAIGVEPREDRRDRMGRNARALGVPQLQVVAGSAPEALRDLERPDAVFVGGGVSLPGVIEACVAALPPGGRLVANGVVIETENVLAQWYSQLGGSLIRVSVSRAAPVGGFTGWRPAMPVTQWSWTRPWTENAVPERTERNT